MTLLFLVPSRQPPWLRTSCGDSHVGSGKEDWRDHSKSMWFYSVRILDVFNEEPNKYILRYPEKGIHPVRENTVTNANPVQDEWFSHVS